MRVRQGTEPASELRNTAQSTDTKTLEIKNVTDGIPVPPEHSD